MMDENRLPINRRETPEMLSVRFRTLGCYPLTGAMESVVINVDDIILEMRSSTNYGGKAG